MLTLTKFSNNIFNPYLEFILESQTRLGILRTFINYFSPTLRCTENDTILKKGLQIFLKTVSVYSLLEHPFLSSPLPQ